MSFDDPQFWIAVLQIIAIDIVLGGAVRRAIAWVEEQYRVLPTAQRSEIEPLHIGIGQRKLGCLFPCVQHSLSSDSHRDSL